MEIRLPVSQSGYNIGDLLPGTTLSAAEKLCLCCPFYSKSYVLTGGRGRRVQLYSFSASLAYSKPLPPIIDTVVTADREGTTTRESDRRSSARLRMRSVCWIFSFWKMYVDLTS